MGKRSRQRRDYVLVLQRPPVIASNWRDHGIPSRWVENADRKVHAHAKPVGLIDRLIAAVTLPGELVIDPAAGGFGVLHAALCLRREFIGCDADPAAVERFREFATVNFAPRGRRVSRAMNANRSARETATAVVWHRRGGRPEFAAINERRVRAEEDESALT
jgi:DNA modification methylase